MAQLLRAQKFPGVELTHVFNRDVERKRTGDTAKKLAPSIRWTSNIDDILDSPDIDVIIETIGGLNPMEGWLKRALTAGKHVVTANKQLIAYRGAALGKLARQHSVALVYNAAVAGGVPVIPAVLHGLQGDTVRRIAGILNGTCNYILSGMEAGEDYHRSASIRMRSRRKPSKACALSIPLRARTRLHHPPDCPGAARRRCRVCDGGSNARPQYLAHRLVARHTKSGDDHRGVWR